MSESLSPWQAGELDIHHISTGRGESTFFILPDGTTMLIDAGEMDPTNPRTTGPRSTPARPSDKRLPYAWLVRYIQRVHPNPQAPTLDYAVLSHFHDDHLGMVHPLSPLAECGAYSLTGLVGVGDALPIGTLLDRGYPTYDYPMGLEDPRLLAWLEGSSKSQEEYGNQKRTIDNYRAFIAWQQDHQGMKAERFRAGSKAQIRLQHAPERYRGFEVRNVAVNGQVWTGQGEAVEKRIPPVAELRQQDILNENLYSTVMVMQYGRFRYYTGGDIAGNVDLGEPEWVDLETPVARVVGAVDVMKMNHHGNRSSSNAFFVSTLQPRVVTQNVWCSNHPGEDVLRRHVSRYLYPGDRDLFANDMSEANRAVIGPLVDRSYASMHGHTVLRVAEGGESYRVYAVEDQDESMRVTGTFGPYEAHTGSTEG